MCVLRPPLLARLHILLSSLLADSPCRSRRLAVQAHQGGHALPALHHQEQLRDRPAPARVRLDRRGRRQARRATPSRVPAFGPGAAARPRPHRVPHVVGAVQAPGHRPELRAHPAARGRRRRAARPGRRRPRGSVHLHPGRPRARLVAVPPPQRQSLPDRVLAGRVRGAAVEQPPRAAPPVPPPAQQQAAVRVGLPRRRPAPAPHRRRRARARRQPARDRRPRPVPLLVRGAHGRPVDRRARRGLDPGRLVLALRRGGQRVQAAAAQRRDGVVDREQPERRLRGGRRRRRDDLLVQPQPRGPRHLARQPPHAGAHLCVVPRRHGQVLGLDDQRLVRRRRQVDPDRQPALRRPVPDPVLPVGHSQGQQGARGAPEPAGVGHHPQGRGCVPLSLSVARRPSPSLSVILTDARSSRRTQPTASLTSSTRRSCCRR